MKISEAFDLYKNNYMFVKGLSKRVLENQDYVKNRIVKALGDIAIEELTLEDVSRWNNTLHFRLLPDGTLQERRNNTIRNDLIRLKMVLRYMRILGHECLNPELIPIPKREDTRRGFLTPEEVDAMIENASSLRNKVVISLFYASGIRLSELIQLDRDSIYDREFTVVGKGNKARTCFIDRRTEELIREYLATRTDDCPALIISAKYKARMTPTNVQLLIRNSARRAGIEKKVFPHLLRHSFATDFIRKGGNIRYLSPMLGHASINTTLIYTHVVDNDLKKQYEMYHNV